MFEPWTIDRIKREHRAAGLYFFSPGAMRGFNSHILPSTWTGVDSTFFITSEQINYSDGTQGDRLFSVRRFSHESKRISTVVSGYRNRTEAYDKARDMAVEEKERNR
jgi:hypothetical protein